MAMQYDVQTVHLNSTGFAYASRVRVKGLVVTSTGTTGGTVGIWDTSVALTAATYEQSGTTVTVTKSAHGLISGQKVGLSFATASGVSATNGNYAITVLTSSTFTITDINSRTIAAGTACSYAVSEGSSSPWIATFDIPAFAGCTNIVFPGEGTLVHNSLYMTLTATYISAVTAFIG
jgi:hypothetical protein